MTLDTPDNIIKNDPLYLSILNQNKHILRPTKCPTICRECKGQYIDRLGLDILIICECTCHRINKNSGETKNDKLCQ
jgi:hypothetical protein